MNSMARAYRAVIVFLLTIGLLGVPNRVPQALAADATPPERIGLTTVPYTESDWWLVRWYDNAFMCSLTTDHDGWPTGDDVYKACGATIYSMWQATPACDYTQPTYCEGLYLLFIGSRPAEKTVEVTLPPAKAWIELTNCNPIGADNRCSTLPNLLITGEEPLPNQTITAVHASINGLLYTCPSAACEVPLSPTAVGGTIVEFWVDSSFGDSSQHFTAQVRVLDTGVATTPGSSGWYVDVISNQWRGRPIATCALVWQTFPPVGEMPTWLSTPDAPALLATDEAYYYLAGRLIAQGLVDVSSCPSGGLLANGYADACGLALALPLVQTWQNRYDTRLVEVARQTGVPAQMMKNLFAAESQFWPGAFKDPYEYGLGQLTENGAEVLLIWNPTFYNEFCPQVLSEETCSRSYVHLDAESQATLRGALTAQAKVDCTDCPEGVDMENASRTIELFALTMLANCEQVSQIVYNATNRMPGAVTNYEDMWRFTIANYHAGAGCLSYAMYSAWQRGAPMTWTSVSSYLTEPCKGVISYVDKIAK